MKIKYNYIVAQPLYKEGYVSCHNCCFRKLSCPITNELGCASNVIYERLESEIFDL